MKGASALFLIQDFPDENYSVYNETSFDRMNTGFSQHQDTEVRRIQ